MEIRPVEWEKCGAVKYTFNIYIYIHTRIYPYVIDLQRILEVYIHSSRALYGPVSLSLNLLPFCQRSF